MVRETTRLEAKKIISLRINKILLDDYYRHLGGGSFALVFISRPDLMKKKKKAREINHFPIAMFSRAQVISCVFFTVLDG